jgi:hypothetical protein
MSNSADLLSLLQDNLGDAAAAGAVLAAARADGVTDAASAKLAREEDWVGWGMPRIRARALVGALQGGGVASPQALASLLPEVPSEESLLAGFRVGGVAKVAPTDVVAALRVALAERLGVLALETRLLDAVEAHARQNDEPCPELFYELERALARRAHADVLAALELPGSFVSDARKRELIARVARVWDALFALQGKIEAWKATWAERSTHAAALLTGQSLLAAQGAAGSAAVLPLDAPDASTVLEAARAVVDAVNRAFAGPGIPVARALAADAAQLRGWLERPELPAAVGASTREELLRKLGIGLTGELARVESSGLQYALGALAVASDAADTVPGRLVALHELGATLPWSWLTGAGNAPRRGLSA